MAHPTRNDYATLNTRIAATLDKITLERLEYNAQRSLWEVHGTYGNYHVRLKEIYAQKGRMYSYYLIRAGNVIVGYDNYPDRKALQLKYGADFTRHLDELIPHEHGQGKTTLKLTQPMTVGVFLEQLCSFEVK